MRRQSKTVPRETYEHVSRERDLLLKALLDAKTGRFEPVAIARVRDEGVIHTFEFFRPLAPDSGYVVHSTRTARQGLYADVTRATDRAVSVQVRTFDDWVAEYERARPHATEEFLKDHAVAAFRVAQQKAFDAERAEREAFLKGASQ